MERYAAGDDAAFADLYDSLASQLYSYLVRQTRNRAHAEDLVQQTFLQVHRARGTFIPGSEVRPWIFAIARRLMIDDLRRKRRETNHQQEELQAGDRDAVDRPDQELVARRLADRLHQALLKIPESQRTAYTLTKQQGLSLVEAAQVLGTTVTAVKLRTHRAVEALRAVLLEHGGDGARNSGAIAAVIEESGSGGFAF
jgi:RNA polymerase sigma-70 factor (ECF subfamily)